MIKNATISIFENDDVTTLRENIFEKFFDQNFPR